MLVLNASLLKSKLAFVACTYFIVDKNWARIFKHLFPNSSNYIQIYL